MSPQLRATSFAMLSILWCGVAASAILWCGVAASAETMRCRSVNGNVNCAGSNGVSCQTINGKKVCVGNGGDVVQSFGGDAPSGDGDDVLSGDVDNDRLNNDDTAVNRFLERHDAHGHNLLSHRQAAKTHARTDRLLIDRD